MERITFCPFYYHLNLSINSLVPPSPPPLQNVLENIFFCLIFCYSPSPSPVPTTPTTQSLLHPIIPSVSPQPPLSGVDPPRYCWEPSSPGYEESVAPLPPLNCRPCSGAFTYIPSTLPWTVGSAWLGHRYASAAPSGGWGVSVALQPSSPSTVISSALLQAPPPAL